MYAVWLSGDWDGGVGGERGHDLITPYGSARRKGGIYVLGRGRIKSK